MTQDVMNRPSRLCSPGCPRTTRVRLGEPAFPPLPLGRYGGSCFQSLLRSDETNHAGRASIHSLHCENHFLWSNRKLWMYILFMLASYSLSALRWKRKACPYKPKKRNRFKSDFALTAPTAMSCKYTSNFNLQNRPYLRTRNFSWPFFVQMSVAFYYNSHITSQY
jgi:hypothetical protein